MGYDALTDSGKGQPQDHVLNQETMTLQSKSHFCSSWDIQLTWDQRACKSLSCGAEQEETSGRQNRGPGTGETGNGSASISQHCLVKDFWSLWQSSSRTLQVRAWTLQSDRLSLTSALSPQVVWPWASSSRSHSPHIQYRNDSNTLI